MEPTGMLSTVNTYTATVEVRYQSVYDFMLNETVIKTFVSSTILFPDFASATLFASKVGFSEDRKHTITATIPGDESAPHTVTVTIAL